MNRRDLLKTGSLALLGVGLPGCAARRPPARQQLRRPPLNLPPVHASWDRVIRTTVGLRPHRPSGFILRAEKLDEKTIIHNYGHGGAGHSLGWGTGALAAELALAHYARRAAVIGCGTVGLTAARQLQRRGFEVTIYTSAVPPYTTSNMALAAFTPTSGLISRPAEPQWEDQFRRAVEIAYRELQLLASPRYGISWINSYNPTDTPPRDAPADAPDDEDALLPAALRTGRVVLGPGEHPFPFKYATERPGMRIEPSIYLDALVRDFLLFGGRLVIRTFQTRRDVMSLTEPIVVNCSGLGSRDLFGDEELTPVKGQLTFLIPQPEVEYGTFGGALAGPDGRRGGAGFIHMMPRSDGIALGGTRERGNWSLDPNEEARRFIVEGHIQLFSAMRAPDPRVQLTRAWQPTAAPRVESFFDLES